MATETELYRAILSAYGVDCSTLPDNLTSTLLTAIAENCGGGGGGASGGGRFEAHLFNNNGALSMDKTYYEIMAAYKAGAVVHVIDFQDQIYNLALIPADGYEHTFCSLMIAPDGTVVYFILLVNPDNSLVRNIYTVKATIESGQN